MPPLIVPSPVILDQSFPRDLDELRMAATALGNLVQGSQDDSFRIYMGGALREFVSSFDWSSSSEPLFRDIYRLHVQWLLQPSDRIVSIELADDEGADPHPLPCGIADSGLASVWSLEVGRLRARHARLVGASPCIGVSCAEAFALLPIDAPACVPQASQGFPVVGPSSVRRLDDAFGHRVRPIPAGASIPVAVARRNIHLLKGTVGRQNASHIPVAFPGARSWSLDTNDDPVPETYLDQLKPITGLPLGVIRSVLYFGDPLSEPILRLLD